LPTIAPPPESGREQALRITGHLSELALDLEPSQVERLMDYLHLLAKWNRVYNLSGIRDEAAMIAPHLLDSLSVHAYIKGPRVLDVGSGAGLPGIPLAVAKPELDFTLLDASAKKTRFIRQAAIELKLHNIRVQQGRIEDYRPSIGFDTVVCRAFASVVKFVAAASRVCMPGGRLVAMKGVLSAEERQTIASLRGRVRVHQLTVPGIEAERQLVEISKA
jgi:16S rRNA (guanine527-N7)-methyltransferase